MNKNRIGFVIMQIGNPELDNIFNEVFIPALSKCSLDPKRIDKDNEGHLLKKEIISLIENAEIIIADLTNERPNCYLEIGYAMGLDKYNNLIFTAREDHNLDSVNHKKGGPKIHFDLSGYDILFWDPNELTKFKEDLINKINRRQIVIEPKSTLKNKPIWDDTWLELQRKYVIERLNILSLNSYVEISISPINESLNLNQSSLLEIADKSQIMTFGWPIAVIFNDSSEYKPTPKSDGIVSDVLREANGYFGKSFDFTYFRKNGQIFITKNIFEDSKFPNTIIPSVRISRTTEILMYVAKYYNYCKLSTDTSINITIKYHGLKERTISFGGYSPLISLGIRQSKENDCVSEITTSLREIESKLPDLVNKILEPLFVLFDFYQIDKNFLFQEVNKFIQETNNARR